MKFLQTILSAARHFGPRLTRSQPRRPQTMPEIYYSGDENVQIEPLGNGRMQVSEYRTEGEAKVLIRSYECPSSIALEIKPNI